MDDEALLQVSRWIREAEAGVMRRTAALQTVERFEEPRAWLRFGIEEVVRFTAVALFVATAACWLVIL